MPLSISRDDAEQLLSARKLELSNIGEKEGCAAQKDAIMSRYSVVMEAVSTTAFARERKFRYSWYAALALGMLCLVLQMYDAPEWLISLAMVATVVALVAMVLFKRIATGWVRLAQAHGLAAPFIKADSLLSKIRRLKSGHRGGEGREV